MDKPSEIRALKNVTRLLGEPQETRYQRYFDRITKMSRNDSVFRKIASASDKEQLADHLIEVTYALIFAGLNFTVSFEPSGYKGPDLEIERDGQAITVEVTRFRKINPGPPVLDSTSDEHFLLPVYGNPTRDTRKASDKILAKFRQITDQCSVIAVWSDDGDLDEIETKFAVDEIRKDASNGIVKIPNGLAFVLYGSHWLGNTQFHCFPFRQLDSFMDQLMNQIEGATLFSLIECALSS